MMFDSIIGDFFRAKFEILGTLLVTNLLETVMVVGST